MRDSDAILAWLGEGLFRPPLPPEDGRCDGFCPCWSEPLSAQACYVTANNWTETGSISDGMTAANSWNGSEPFSINIPGSTTGNLPTFNNPLGLILNGNGSTINGERSGGGLGRGGDGSVDDTAGSRAVPGDLDEQPPAVSSSAAKIRGPE